MVASIEIFKGDLTNLMNKLALTDQVVNYLKNVAQI